MNRSRINWLVNPDGTQGYSWNPIKGCSPAHIGCTCCYAARMAATRLAHLPEYAGLARRPYVDGNTWNVARWTGEVRFFPERLAEPLRRRKPSAIFPVDMGDLFHEKVTNEQIAAVFGAMAATPQHRYTVLTKRARRMREWFEWIGEQDGGPSLHAAWCLLDEERRSVGDDGPIHCKYGPNPDSPWPPPNVALLVSVSDQPTAELILELLQTPAAMRGVSFEPAVAPVDFTFLNDGSWYDREGAQCYDALRGHAYYRDGEHGLGGGPKLDWVIVGGESGPNARPCNVECIRSVVSQCAEARVPCWVKQMHIDGKLVDDVERFPADLCVRQRPAGW